MVKFFNKLLSTFDEHDKTQLLAKFTKILHMGFRATLNFWKLTRSQTMKPVVHIILVRTALNAEKKLNSYQHKLLQWTFHFLPAPQEFLSLEKTASKQIKKLGQRSRLLRDHQEAYLIIFVTTESWIKHSYQLWTEFYHKDQF